MSDKTLDQMKTALLSGAMSRREFMQRTAAFGMSAAAASNLILSSTASAATPKKGGRLRVAAGTGGTTDTLDPVKFFSTNDYQRAFATYSPLVGVGRKSEAVPALAESWEPNADATQWVFNLRKGATWSNGKDLTPQDVIYSLQRHLAPKSESPAKPLLEQVSEMKAEGKTAVRMTLKTANADLPVLFSQPQFAITQDGVDTFDKAVSIGAFLVKEMKVGERTELVRNPDYWGEPAHVDEIQLDVVTDINARMNAIMAGKYDIAEAVDNKLIDLLKNAPGVELVASKSSQHTNLAMMCDRAPTDNLDLRLAMKYLIPRQKIVDNVFKGYGQIGNDHQVAPTDPFYCADIQQRGYDVDKAKFHLKKAGMEGITIDLHTSDQATNNSEAIALLCKEGAKPAGLNYNVVVVPPGSYWTTAWMQQPFVVSGWNARPTADLMLSIANKSDGGWNETQWKSERFDKLLAEARGELDNAKRKEMYCEMQRMLHEDGGVGMMAFYDLIDAKRSNVGGLDPHPAGMGRNAFFSTEVWLNA